MQINVSWPVPTTREDGAVLNPSEIASYDLQMQVAGAPGFTSISNENVTSFSISNPAPGTYNFRCFTVDTKGNRSTKPVTGSCTVAAPLAAPSAPASLNVVLA